jgi:hypothetical protein
MSSSYNIANTKQILPCSLGICTILYYRFVRIMTSYVGPVLRRRPGEDWSAEGMLRKLVTSHTGEMRNKGWPQFHRDREDKRTAYRVYTLLTAKRLSRHTWGSTIRGNPT